MEPSNQRGNNFVELISDAPQSSGRSARSTRRFQFQKAKDKFVTMLTDPQQLITVGNIDQWEEETRKYLRENLSEADEILFMDITGVPRPPIYKWEERRAEQLGRLHYRSHQLRKILDGLSGAP